MKTTSFFAVLIVCACLITFMQYEALAQAQRMGIRTGIYKAPGKSSVRVDATCIDQTRNAPSGNNYYKYVI
ncbi:MAG: hypothetical protein EPN82_02370 [Bacteroidetes bacterium]|nr:MAG: hypothetical protein EPN82_02370 [Bacteroidota bacterium]